MVKEVLKIIKGMTIVLLEHIIRICKQLLKIILAWVQTQCFTTKQDSTTPQ